MAKKSAIEKNKKRIRMVAKYANRRASLKAIINNKDVSPEERFDAQLKLNQVPKNALPGRIHNRCELSGRPKGFYRKFRISRIALRELASQGKIPGVVKSSW